MTGLVIVLVLICVGLVGYMVRESMKQDGYAAEPPPTDEELLQARLDLLKIERGIDLTLAKQESRRYAQRTKEAIAEAFKGKGD